MAKFSRETNGDFVQLQQEVANYKNLLGRFIDKQVINYHFSHKFTTNGEIKDICVLFTDVRGFTKFSETAGLQATNSFLNNFYDIVIDHTYTFEGIMDKFMGDGTLSIFGVYDEGNHYIERAVKTAKAIMKDFKSMTSQKDEPDLYLGIGLNAGPAIVGAFGNGDFVGFTAIGHTVNVGARVMSKSINNEILATKSVISVLQESEYIDKGKYELKNVSKPMELFEIVEE